MKHRVGEDRQGDKQLCASTDRMPPLTLFRHAGWHGKAAWSPLLARSQSMPTPTKEDWKTAGKEKSIKTRLVPNLPSAQAWTTPQAMDGPCLMRV